MKKIQKILIGTHNKGKIKEISYLLSKKIKKISPFELKIKSPRETGKTFKANSELKAKYLDQSNNFLDVDLILMIQIINECLINYQKINDKRIHIELCLMRIASIDSIKKKNP